MRQKPSEQRLEKVRERLGGKGRCVQPISVYRIIESCIHAGIVGRFESGNALYVYLSGNPRSSRPRSSRIVFGCQECGYICDANATSALDPIACRALSRAFVLESVRDAIAGLGFAAGA